MSECKTIQVFEYETIRVGSKGFDKEQFDLLAKFSERHQGQYYSIGYHSIRFTNYVGVLQVAGLTIEILPKAGRVSNRQLWHDVLLQMLKVSGFLNMRAVSVADLKMRKGSLFDVYLEVFLAHCRNIQKEGLVRQYLLRSSNQNALRGRLLFNEQLKHNLIRKERFFSASQNYTRDNVFNQILCKALMIVGKIAGASILRKEAAMLCQQMEDISEKDFTPDSFSRLKYDRTNERYRDAINLAELIILNYLPDLQGGNRSVLALLFPMESLFESYVASVLKRAARSSPCKISTQRSKHFWRGDQNGLKTIRPDIVVDWKDESGPRLTVLDTKWKLPKNNLPNDADLKQMFVYNEYFEAEASNLVYPATGAHGVRSGHFVKAKHGGCSMWRIRIIDFELKSINQNLGHEMLEELMSEASRGNKGGNEKSKDSIPLSKNIDKHGQAKINS
jgi:5-methylcytosine-specific restriction enzyme subunit McrC